MPFLTPATTPEETKCRSILIPDDRDWLGVVTGVLLPLCYPSAWEQSEGGITPEDAASRSMTMLLEFLESECFPMGLQDIRILGGILQKTFDNEAWLDVGAVQSGNPITSVIANTLTAGSNATATLVNGVLTLGIPRGANGAQGIQGIQGIPGENGTNGTPGAAGADAVMPVGTVVWFAGEDIPTGWLPCNANDIAISQYPELYAVIGNTFGDGSIPGATFRAPFLNNRFIKGYSGTGTLGNVGGSPTKTLTAENLPVHSHPHSHAVNPFSMNINMKDGGAAGSTSRALSSGAAGNNVTNPTATNETVTTDEDATTAGSGTAFNIEPEYMQLRPIICAVSGSALDVDFRMTGCDLEWTKTGDTWVTLVDLTECTVQGEKGDQGEQGIQGIPGEQGLPGDCECDDSPQPIDNDLATYCGIAEQITNRMSQHLTDVIEEIDASVSIANAISSLISTVPVVGWELDAVTETVTEAVNYTTNATQADVNQTRIDISKCSLYNAIIDNGGYSWEMLTQWHTDESLYWATQLVPGMVIWVSTLVDFPQSFWAQQAYIGSLSPSNECTGCIPECAESQARVWFADDTEFPNGVGVSIAPPGISAVCAGSPPFNYPYRQYDDSEQPVLTLETPMWCTGVSIQYFTDTATHTPPTISINGGTPIVENAPLVTGARCGIGSSFYAWAWENLDPILIETIKINFTNVRPYYRLHLVQLDECE